MKVHINARSGLGDTVYFLSIVQSLVRKYPDIEISIICWNSGMELYSGIKAITKLVNANDFINFMGRQWDVGSVQSEKFFGQSIGRVDYYIDLQPKESYQQENLAVSADKRIAVNPDDRFKDKYDYVISTIGGEHILDTYRKMLTKVFDVDEFVEPGNIPCSEQIKSKVDKIFTLVSKNNRPIVCIHPGAKSKEKLWDILKWGDLVNWLIDVKKIQPILIGSSTRFAGKLPILDIPSAEAIHRLSFDRAFNLSGQTESVLLLSEFIRQSKLYIGLDTGPTHIASVLKIPTLELFKKESDLQFDTWQIRGDKVKVIGTDNMSEIKTEEVIKILSQWSVFNDI